MLHLDLLTAFFGWCSVINLIVLMCGSAVVIWQKDRIAAIHSRWFAVPKDVLGTVYIKYLAYYKIGVFLFNVVPYIALKILS